MELQRERQPRHRFPHGAGRFAENRAYSLGANYSAGAFSAGAAWLHNNGRGAGTTGAYDPMVLPGSDGTLVDATVSRALDPQGRAIG